MICKNYIPPRTHLLLFDWRDPWICPMRIRTHRERLGDSRQSTVDDREGHRTNLPKTTTFPRCYEQRGGSMHQELPLQRLHWKYWGTSFCETYIQKERKGWEKIKSWNGKDNQNRPQEENQGQKIRAGNYRGSNKMAANITLHTCEHKLIPKANCLQNCRRLP